MSVSTVFVAVLGSRVILCFPGKRKAKNPREVTLRMDRITMDILKQAFLDRHSGWCVSPFMPTHRAGREMEQYPIRFKNLLREAEESLTAKGLRY
jgi:hypothetical protein